MDLLEAYELSEWMSDKEKLNFINEKTWLKFNHLSTLRSKICRLKKKWDWKNPYPKKRSNKKTSKIEDFLNKRGIWLKELNELLYIKNIESTKTKSLSIKKPTKKFKIWVVSDTHLWAKTCALDELSEVYKRFKEEWITEVLHCWDLDDWDWKVYQWHLYELNIHWFDEHLEFLVNKYPKIEWIKTYVIWWNHDESFIKTAWSDILKRMAEKRDDIVYLWMYDNQINIWWVKFTLHHWAWWWSYAVSYKLQKFVEWLTWDRKPQVYLLWHYHTFVYTCIRNIHCMTCASFQKPNDFSKRLWLASVVWWFILHIEVSEDWSITSFLPEFIPFYF